jgi:hypothetical protein
MGSYAHGLSRNGAIIKIQLLLNPHFGQVRSAWAETWLPVTLLHQDSAAKVTFQEALSPRLTGTTMKGWNIPPIEMKNHLQVSDYITRLK